MPLTISEAAKRMGPLTICRRLKQRYCWLSPARNRQTARTGVRRNTPGPSMPSGVAGNTAGRASPTVPPPYRAAAVALTLTSAGCNPAFASAVYTARPTKKLYSTAG